MRRLLRIVSRRFKPGRIGRYLNPNTYPNNEWYRKHLDRNYDVVFLGDADRIPKLQIPDGVKAFDWSLDGQNLLWDYNVIRHFFSILKPGGLVVFPLSEHFIEDLNRKVDERKYYIPMMPYFFSQSKLKQTYIRICKRIPLLALWPRLSYGSRTCQRVGDANVDLLITQICNFLDERDLRACFVLIWGENTKTEIKNTILSLFCKKRCELKVLSSMVDYKWENLEI